MGWHGQSSLYPNNRLEGTKQGTFHFLNSSSPYKVLWAFCSFSTIWWKVKLNENECYRKCITRPTSECFPLGSSTAPQLQLKTFGRFLLRHLNFLIFSSAQETLPLTTPVCWRRVCNCSSLKVGPGLADIGSRLVVWEETQTLPQPFWAESK